MKFYVIGDVTVDHMHFLEHIPVAGEDITPTSTVLLPGGAGGTMAFHAACLGHEVTLAARVGADPFEKVALQNLRRAKVNLEAIQFDEHIMTSTVTILVTPNAERTMISASGANRLLEVAAFNAKTLENNDALIISAYALIGGAQREYTQTAIGLAKQKKIPVFIDLGTGAVNDAGTELLGMVKSADYLLMNQLELFRITGKDSISEAVGHLGALGLQTVVVKVGAHGALLWTPKESELLEGYAIASVADTTGAGDAFTAAFAHAIMSGFTSARAVAYANVAGALAAMVVGAQGTALTHNDIFERLEQEEATRAARVIAKQTRSGKRVKPKDLPKPVEAVKAPSPAVKPAVVAAKPAPSPEITEEPKKRGRKRAS